MRKWAVAIVAIIVLFFQNNLTVAAEVIVNNKTLNHAEKPIAEKWRKVNFQNEHQSTLEGWTLVWNDEFNGRWLNPANWNIEIFASEKNNELQFYSPNNVKVQNGKLQLISKKEREAGKMYTSGAIQSMDKFFFQYGKVEMRAKLPPGKGMFPAFWMMPNEKNRWLPEIDIMEMLGDKPNEIWMVSHWLDQHNKLNTVSHMFSGVDYTKDFHLYGLEWSPEKITWFIDGVEKFSTTSQIPDMDMYLYLNTAIGGNWPGNPDETTEFPQLFEVDYVRVYQQTGGDS